VLNFGTYANIVCYDKYHTNLMVQIVNAFGKEETALAAYHLSDGINQCHVGFLQCHFVSHALTFDDALVAQVTEGITNDHSPIKRKKCQYNMVYCLTLLISDFGGRKMEKPQKLSCPRFRKGRRIVPEKMTLLTCLLANEQEGCVSYDAAGATNDVLMARYTNPSVRENGCIPTTRVLHSSC
jgi:hypothetical protein